MPDEKSFWTTVPGIITGIAGIVTAVTGLIVALNGAGFFSKTAAAGKPATEIKSATEVKPDGKKNIDTSTIKNTEQAKPAQQLKAEFSMTKVKIEDHEYTIVSSTLEATTPETNSLAIKIKYKNNSNYSPATFWNEGFRLAVDGSLTAPSGDLSQLVERHAEQVGTVTFDVPNNAKSLALHILDVGKDIAIPIKLTAD
ncbi:hypothetical protein [Mucilaginibacter flavus]|uniref:hypothetical protein n=1 Tax=Mucilaginibacter flavus TaxID=931504 RepID=UPI0025B34508|nr:hypothetical protein [Mucilaginibacter flavus]MDN3581539.1 hypothetical protein [Mucilaginibacter flavus]